MSGGSGNGCRAAGRPRPGRSRSGKARRLSRSYPFSKNRCQSRKKTVLEPGPIQAGHIRPGHDDDVHGLCQQRLVPPEELPEPPFDPVPDDSRADLPAYDNGQPREAQAVTAVDQREITAPDAAAVPIKAREVLFLPYSLEGSQALIHPTEMRFRPLRLLLLMTSWPPLVSMRTRKPCVFLRLLLFG